MVIEIVIFIFLLLVLLAIAASFRPVRLKAFFIMDSQQTAVEATVLDPLLRLRISLVDNGPFMSVYVLKLRLYRARLGKRKDARLDLKTLILSADIFDIEADTHFGFDSPFSTGMACGVMGIITSFLRPSRLNMHPNFLPAEPYVRTDITARLNIGNTILNFAENKKNKSRRHAEWSKT